MSTSTQAEVEKIRADAAMEERAAILQMIEHAMRQLSHGHGANGAQILQQLVEEVRSRA